MHTLGCPEHIQGGTIWQFWQPGLIVSPTSHVSPASIIPSPQSEPLGEDRGTLGSEGVLGAAGGFGDALTGASGGSVAGSGPTSKQILGWPEQLQPLTI